jgi:RNA polymerase sigma factor (sigma-70 family)
MAQRGLKQATPAASEDAELAARAVARDAGAFRAIMQRHNRRLYRIARGILRNNTEAEDAVQDAYVSAFTNPASYRGESTLATWLSRIVMNEALGRLRRRRPTVDLAALESVRSEAEIIQFPQSTPSDDPERTMAQRQILQLVEQATDNLPEVFRLVRHARDRRNERRRNLRTSRHQTGNRQNPAAPSAATRSRPIRRADRAGADGCISVCWSAVRASDRGCDGPTRLCRVIEQSV